MTGRARVGLFVVVAILGGGAAGVADFGAAGHALAQEGTRQQLASELARLMMDSTARRAIDGQVRATMLRTLTDTLQERLNRRLFDVEVDMLARIVQRFVTQALPPSRTEEIAAEVYRRYFDDAELSELLQFQRSNVARKAARLGPEIASETGDAINRELRTSAALPDALEELRHAFPVLARPESP